MPKKNKSPQNLVIKANNNIKTPNINKSNLKINTDEIILIPKLEICFSYIAFDSLGFEFISFSSEIACR